MALYVHCGAHCVNLVSSAVSEMCPAVRDVLYAVNDLGVLFSQSLTAISKFKDLVAAEAVPSSFRQKDCSAQHAGLCEFKQFQTYVP